MRAVLQELRKIVAAPTRAAGDTPLGTGCARLDSLLGGGLPRGRLVEVAGPWSSGKTALVLGAVARVTGRRQLCAYIDGRGELYPPSAAALGVDLERLLVVRPPPRDVARAAEIVARSGAFPLVVIDLPDDQRIEDGTAGRLRAASAAGPTLVALATRPGGLSAAVVKLEVAAHVVTLRKGGQAPPGSQVRLARDFHDETPPPFEEKLVLRATTSPAWSRPAPSR
jgi:recombination protein RecA